MAVLPLGHNPTSPIAAAMATLMQPQQRPRVVMQNQMRAPQQGVQNGPTRAQAGRGHGEPGPIANGFDPNFGSALDQFLAAAQGVTVGSGTRTPERQAQLWANKVAEVRQQNPGMSQAEIEELADNWVARPGASNHERGRAADLQYADDAARAWAHANAANYGLYFPMGHEPWHVELRR